jgi:Cu+-exporting ATPase
VIEVAPATGAVGSGSGNADSAATAGEFLALAAAVESASEHPLARAIVDAARARGLRIPNVESFIAEPGIGIRARVQGKSVQVGRLETHSSDKIALRAAKLYPGATLVSVVINGCLAGTLALDDPVKATAPEAIAELRRIGLRVIMVTGDREATAWVVARPLGLDGVHAGVTPAGKQELVRESRAAGEIVIFAGDGINDAPALAAADVGIAMGTGTDVAMHSSGLVLVKGDLRGIVRARHLSRAVLRNIKQNLFLAFVYNGLGIPIAAGALYPVFGWRLNPMVAGVAMSLS